MNTNEYVIRLYDVDELIKQGNLRLMMDAYNKMGDVGTPLFDDLKSSDYDRFKTDRDKLWNAVKTKLHWLNTDLETVIRYNLTHMLPACFELKRETK